MRLSLQNILNSFSKQEINKITESLNNHTPEALKQRDEHNNRALGFDQARTSYAGNREQLQGITTWIDPRDNIRHELKTIIVIEEYGNTKSFVYVTSIDGRQLARAHKNGLTTRDMEHYHDLYRKLFFLRINNAFVKDPKTNFEPGFNA